jgi:Tol biopolymer transport system component
MKPAPTSLIHGALICLLALIGVAAADVLVRDLQAATTTLVSVNSAGTGSGNGYSNDPVLSPDGRYVAFRSGASDLVAGDANGTYDVFVRDLQAGTTTLVSVNSAGTGSGNQDSFAPVLSADGRYVFFGSRASDLVAGDANGTADVFVRDLQAGTTTLVSVASDGTGSGNGSSYEPFPGQSLSADGRYVAFESDASDLVAGDTNGTWDVFVRDLQAGTTTLVSAARLIVAETAASGTGSGNGDSYAPAVSADGRYVAFFSWASDLVKGDTNNRADVFVRDLQAGTTRLVSWRTACLDCPSGSGNDDSYVWYAPALSADGRYVAFYSYASDLVGGDTNGTSDVFVHDLQAGTTTLVSVKSAGAGSGNGYSLDPVLSPDGRYVAFQSGASDLVAGTTATARPTCSCAICRPGPRRW